MTVRHTVLDSPLGALTLVAEGDALSGIYFEGHQRGPAPEALGPGEEPDCGTDCETGCGTGCETHFGQARRQLAEYFSGRRRHFDLPLAPRGDSFQQRVWKLLEQIPYGETRTYGELARELGDPALAQAVGAANGRNPLSIVVPCHRVIGADGRLTGYAGGLGRKRFLLDLEESHAGTGPGRLF